jgi:hypothetical protein
MLTVMGGEINSSTNLISPLLLSLTGKIRSRDVEIPADSSDTLLTRLEASNLWVTIKTAI